MKLSCKSWNFNFHTTNCFSPWNYAICQIFFTHNGINFSSIRFKFIGRNLQFSAVAWLCIIIPHFWTEINELSIQIHFPHPFLETAEKKVKILPRNDFLCSCVCHVKNLALKWKSNWRNTFRLMGGRVDCCYCCAKLNDLFSGGNRMRKTFRGFFFCTCAKFSFLFLFTFPIEFAVNLHTLWS